MLHRWSAFGTDADGTPPQLVRGVTVSADGKSFVYIKTWTGTAGECQTIDNTAIITGRSSTAFRPMPACIVGR